MNRKLIGYKYPYETIGGYYIKDKILRYTGHGVYEIEFQGNKLQRYALPREIVESFEPIYEEFGCFEDIISHFKGDLVMINKSIVVTPEEVLNGSSGIREVLNIIINKQKYQFTPEFEAKLKELGISI